MKKEKMTLFVSTTAFRRNLLNLLGELKQIYNGKWKVYLSVVRNSPKGVIIPLNVVDMLTSLFM